MESNDYEERQYLRHFMLDLDNFTREIENFFEVVAENIFPLKSAREYMALLKKFSKTELTYFSRNIEYLLEKEAIVKSFTILPDNEKRDETVKFSDYLERLNYSIKLELKSRDHN